MSRHIILQPHLNSDALELRYRNAKEPYGGRTASENNRNQGKLNENSLK